MRSCEQAQTKADHFTQRLSSKPDNESKQTGGQQLRKKKRKKQTGLVRSYLVLERGLFINKEFFISK